MQEIVLDSQPFCFNYPSIDQSVSLYVQAWIYDVTSGSASLVVKVNMSSVALGVYSGNYTGTAGKRYLVICAVFTDNTYSTADTTYAPRALEFECVSNGSSFSIDQLICDYTDYGQSSGLYVRAKAYDVSTGTPVFVSNVTMTHVAFGCYFGAFSATDGDSYLISKIVYTDSGFTTVDTSRAPAVSEAQAYSFSAGTSVDPGVSNVRKGRAYNINGTDLVGTYDLFSTNGTPGDDVAASCVAALASYLGLISGLTVLQEWPYANEQLSYPSLTIMAGQGKIMPQIPYEASRSAVDGNGDVTVNMVTGGYDANFQLDLWCRDKKERKQYLDLIQAAFDAQAVDVTGKDNPVGLSLEMTSYFNEYVRFEIDTCEHVDDEAASQRQERREKIRVLVNAREIRQRKYKAIGTIQLLTQVTEKSVDLSDDSADTDTYSVPSP